MGKLTETELTRIVETEALVQMKALSNVLRQKKNI